MKNVFCFVNHEIKNEPVNKTLLFLLWYLLLAAACINAASWEHSELMLALWTECLSNGSTSGHLPNQLVTDSVTNKKKKARDHFMRCAPVSYIWEAVPAWVRVTLMWMQQKRCRCYEDVLALWSPFIFSSNVLTYRWILPTSLSEEGSSVLVLFKRKSVFSLIPS